MHYYSPFPELKKYRSLEGLIYAEPKIRWNNFDYNEGIYKGREYVHPTFKKFGGIANWENKELKEMITEEERKRIYRIERLKKRTNEGEAFDPANAENVFELLYFSRGIFHGHYPNSPAMLLKRNISR